MLNYGHIMINFLTYVNEFIHQRFNRMLILFLSKYLLFYHLTLRWWFMLFIPYWITSKAKLSATYAFYMITANIFLNRLLASWAFSRVFLNPNVIIFLLIRKFCPFLNFKARSRFMRFLLAFKTICSATWAFNIILLKNGGFLTEKLAMIRRTVTYGFVYDRIIDTNLLFIEFKKFRGYLCNELWKYGAFLTLNMHAREEDPIGF